MQRILIIAAVLASLVVFSTIGAGIHLIRNKEKAGRTGLVKVLRTNLAVFVPTVLAALIVLAPGIVSAASGAGEVNGLGLMAAALSTGLAAIGTGYAVGVVGSSALGAVSEDPSILGQTLIFVGLAEGIAIYGLIISIMILGQL